MTATAGFAPRLALATLLALAAASSAEAAPPSKPVKKSSGANVVAGGSAGADLINMLRQARPALKHG